MVRPGERRLNKKFIKLPSGKTIIRRFRDGAKQASCGSCSKKLQGTPKGTVNEIRKLSKTEKRPSVLFGGILCKSCRDIIYEESIKVKLKIKKIEDIKPSYKEYVSKAILKVGI
jgi:large subunit ribosomal protein L34e